VACAAGKESELVGVIGGIVAVYMPASRFMSLTVIVTVAMFSNVPFQQGGMHDAFRRYASRGMMSGYQRERSKTKSNRHGRDGHLPRRSKKE
jgi:hypothetical protein